MTVVAAARNDLPRTSADRLVRTAPLAARCAAYVLDLCVAAGFALLFSAAAWGLLLLDSHFGTTQPADEVIYLAFAVALLWLPAWACLTVACWSRGGQSPGQIAMSVSVVGQGTHPPRPGRALLRFIIRWTCFVPLALTPPLLVGAIAAAAQDTLPPLLIGTIVLLFVIGMADPLCSLLRRDRRALHDLATGTRVVQER